MAKGISIHIGVTEVAPAAYDGEALRVDSADDDAIAMRDIAARQGFIAKPPLIGAGATLSAVRGALMSAANDLREERGGILLLTYSGHGFQRKKSSGIGVHESWALYDGQIIDHEIGGLLKELPSDARIIVVSDSCRSGTIIENLLRKISRKLQNGFGLIFGVGEADPLVGEKEISPGLLKWLLVRNNQEYKEVEERYRKSNQKTLPATLLLAACRDNQDAYFKENHGVFTDALLQAWNGSSFGSYNDFYEGVKQVMAPTLYRQYPVILPLGNGGNSLALERPFTIS